MAAIRLQPWGQTVLDRTPSDHDGELLAKLRAGDRAAAEHFVREHAGWMLARAQSCLRDAHLAEDCVQEAFLQAFRGIGAFEGRSALKSWLYRILINAALMKRRARRTVTELPFEHARGQLAADHGGAPCASEVATPHDILETKEARRLVAAKMSELPDSYRAVLLLRDIEGLSTEETAQALAMTVGAVKVRLHRARAAFRALVAPVVNEYI